MNRFTRREVISPAVLAAGAWVVGCGKDNGRSEKMLYRPLGKTGLEISVIGFVAERMRAVAQLFGC